MADWQHDHQLVRVAEEQDRQEQEQQQLFFCEKGWDPWTGEAVPLRDCECTPQRQRMAPTRGRICRRQ